MTTGFLHIISGSMFSGKTSTLINLYNQFQPSVLVFNHSYDTRYDSNNNSVTTHDQIKIPCNSILCLSDILRHPNFQSTKFIMIDEIQFFTNIKTHVLQLVERYNKYVVLSGLMIDINRNPFGELAELVPLSDRFDHKLSRCFYCDTEGLFTIKKNADCVEIIDVGSSDKYYAVCRYHYLNKNEII